MLRRRTATPPAALLSMLLRMLACMHSMRASAAAAGALAQQAAAAAAAGTHAYTADAPALHARRLLHGRRAPQAWVRCSRCNIVSCMGSRCSGHCRRRRQVELCRRPRPGSIAVAAGAAGLLVPIALEPHILCLHGDPAACSFSASQIQPHIDASGILSVAAPNGSVSARCEAVPAPPQTPNYGVCVCDYTSADGSEGHSAFCQPTQSLESTLLRVDRYLEEAFVLTGLLAEPAEEEDVMLGGETATIVYFPPIEDVDYEVEDSEVDIFAGHL